MRRQRFNALFNDGETIIRAESPARIIVGERTGGECIAPRKKIYPAPRAREVLKGSVCTLICSVCNVTSEAFISGRGARATRWNAKNLRALSRAFKASLRAAGAV